MVLPLALPPWCLCHRSAHDIILRLHRQYAAGYHVIHSEDWEEHLLCLQVVLQDLQQAGLTAKPKKCSIEQYLGDRIGRDPLTVNHRKRKLLRVRDFPQPIIKTMISCAFLGLAGSQCCFVPHFSSVAALLSDLTKKGQLEKIQWKKSLPVCATLTSTGLSLLETNASKTGLGAVLSLDFNTEEHLVTSVCRKLMLPEMRYGAVEREALGVSGSTGVTVLSGWARVYTRHRPHPKAKDTITRITRWFFSLQDYSFQVQRCSGEQHGNSDGLSCFPSAFPLDGSVTIPGSRYGWGGGGYVTTRPC